MEMKKYKLENLCKAIIDCPHSTPNWRSEGIRVIRNFNIKNGTLDFSDGYFVDEDSYEERTRRAIPETNDLVISREAPMGAACIIPENLKCCLGQRLVLLKVDNLICDSKYLLFSIQSDYVQKQIEVINKTGSIVSNLNISDLRKLMIPYRNLPEQKKIASILSSLDDKIALNNRINSKLEQMAKRLYDYWFVQFDFPRSVSGEPCLHELSRTDDGNARSDFPVSDEYAKCHPELVSGSPYKSSGGKMVWNEELKREIPEGWEVKRLGELYSVKKGELITEKEAGIGKIKVVAAGVDFSYYTDTPNRIKNTITISGSGANAGFINYWREPIFASDCTTINGDSDIKTLLAYLHLQMLQSYIYQYSQGSAQPHVYPEDIKNIPIINYPDELLSKFSTLLLDIDSKISNNIKESQKLTSMRDKLLPLLMNGQVVVE